MASPVTENVLTDETLSTRETIAGISETLVSVENELELMRLSDEISSSLLDANLSQYQ